MSNRRNPKLTWTLTGLILTAGLAATAALPAKLGWALGWLIGASAITFLFYGWDKLAARKDWPRIPELTLHLLSLIGGTPGALAGMHLFRHKTVKGSFRIVFYAILVLQVAAVVWLATR